MLQILVIYLEKYIKFAIGHSTWCKLGAMVFYKK